MRVNGAADADITAARHDGIIEAVTDADVETTADSGYQGAGGTVYTPVKRPVGKGLARLRAPVERAFAQLKQWRVLQRVRISPNRITALVHAIFVIHREQQSLARA